MPHLPAILSLSLMLFIGGCVSSMISEAPVSTVPTHKVQAIAMAPGGGLMADAVAVELVNRGFTVIDSASTSNLLVRLNLNEVEVMQPDGLAKLKEQGIDAFLTVRAAAGYDGLPESVSARMNSTYTGRVLAGITWQNGRGCAAGSPCDRFMRKGLSEAAREIADALSKRIEQGT